MRAVHRHGLTGLIVVALAATGVLGAGGLRDSTSPYAETVSSSAEYIPTPPSFDREVRTSRSGSRAPGAVAKRRAELAKQHKEIARVAKEAQRQRDIARLGYDPAETDVKEIARQIAANRYGWGGDQFSCYDQLIVRESNWNHRAENPTSGAYGLPQALPAEKMATEGPDWRTNPGTQLRWGLKYVKQTYGTPCSALNFHYSHNWY